MRKPIIAGNWKMNKTLSEAKTFAEEVKSQVPRLQKWNQLFVHQHYSCQRLLKRLREQM